MTVINVSKILNDHVEHVRRAWVHDRSSTVGASEVFGCLRKSWFDKKGTDQGYSLDPDYTDSWGATERGNIIENHFLVPAFRNHLPAGLSVSYEGDDQQTIVAGRSSATPDSVISGFPADKPLVIETNHKRIVIDNPGSCIVFEYKSVHPLVSVEEVKPMHAGQAIVQMGLLREVEGLDPSYAVILYVNASHLDDVEFFVVEYDDKQFQYSKERANQVFDAEDPSDLKSEGKLTGMCKFCPWKLACGEAIVLGIPDDSGMIGHNSQHYSEFEQEIENYVHWKQEEEKAGKQKKQAQENLKDLLSESGMRTAKSETWTVSWSKVNGRKTLDQKALAADGVDLSKYQRVGAAYDRLVVKAKEVKSDD